MTAPADAPRQPPLTRAQVLGGGLGGTAVALVGWLLTEVTAMRQEFSPRLTRIETQLSAVAHTLGDKPTRAEIELLVEQKLHALQLRTAQLESTAQKLPPQDLILRITQLEAAVRELEDK